MRATLLTACLALSLPAPAAAQQRFLLIDLDDVGYDLLEVTETPFLDRIARAGMVLENFYSAPLCSPSRIRMQLGARCSHPSVLMGNLIECDDTKTMPLDPLVPLGEFLATNGKTCAKIGKWHLGGTDVQAPNKAGWQHYSGVLNNPVACTGGDYFDFHRVTNGQTEQLSGYLTEVETDDGIAAVRAGFDVVSVSYHAIHDPLHVPPPHLLFKGTPKTDKKKRKAMLRALDFEVGRLVSEGLKAGYTVFVFSDNGSPVSTGGQKGFVHEGGVRVPFVAIGPGIVPGVVSEALYGWEDVYATVAEAFGIPTGPNEGPDSVSFLDELYQPDGVGRPWNFSERWFLNGSDPRQGARWRRGIRDARFKIHRDQSAQGEEQLYDLKLDPGETVDLLQGPLTPRQQAAYDTLSAVLDGL